MGKGKRYELAIKNAINEDTRRCVKAHRPDFSGSSAGEVADVMVVWESRASPKQSQNTSSSDEVWQNDRMSPQRPSGHPERDVAYLELKKRDASKRGNRATVMSGSSDGDSGLDELQSLLAQTPSWTSRYVVFKFPNTEPLIYEARNFEQYLLDGDYDDDIEYFGARLTPSNNVSIRKPLLSEARSASAADADHIEVCRAIGIEDYYHTV
jgi:hypothetical protein